MTTQNETKQTAGDELLPQAVESERDIIGAMLLDQDAARKVLARLRPDQFYLSEHKTMIEHAAQVFQKFGAVDLTLLQDQISKASGLDNGSEIAAKLGAMAQGVASTASLAGHILKVEETARRRAALETIEKTRRALLNGDPAADADMMHLYGQLGTALYDATKKPLTWKSGAFFLENEPPALQPILTGLFDQGDKVAVIAASKAGKTFFIAQLALSLASGLDFLKWENPGGRKRRVMLVQFEVQEAHYHRRLQAVSQAQLIKGPDVCDTLRVYCARGCDLSGAGFMGQIETAAMDFGAELVILDPLYKLMDGAENAAEDMKPILKSFDRLAERAGVAVLYVHHDAKGTPGDRALGDRGSGSGVLGRDYDAAIMLTRHADADKATVVEAVSRNYAEPEPFTISFETVNGISFMVREDIPAVKQTSMNRGAAATPKLKTMLPAIRELLPDGAVPVAKLQVMLEDIPGMNKTLRDQAIKYLEAEGELLRATVSKGDRKGVTHYIGSPEAIAEIKAEAQKN